MNIGVIGGGAFGTALAAVQASAGRDVQLWMRDQETANEVNKTRHNPTRLPSIKLPKNLVATTDLSILGNCEILLLVLPAQTSLGFLTAHIADLPQVPIIACAKGIDRTTAEFQSDILEKFLPKERIGVLSGPGFASEIAAGLPTAMALGAFDEESARAFCERLSTSSLRLYPNDDVLGTELGGALKNLIAIGCGVAVGAGLGQSARAAILTRGFSEMMRLGLALGAKAETLAGLAGLGDLTLTATSETSRNYSLGIALGAGKPPPKQTVEGAYTASIALQIAEKHGLDLPVIATTARVIEGEISVATAVTQLLSRPLKKEF